MSKFLKNALPYLEIDSIKRNILKGILETCNQEYQKHCKILESVTKYEANERYIVNNNQKYYLMIFPYKQYKMMYFFKANNGFKIKENACKNTLIPATDEFCIEIDGVCFPKKHYLFEGYMYTNNNIMHYDMTDVIYIDAYINANYTTRLSLLHQVLYDKLDKLDMLNGTITIGIHHVLDSTDLIPVFQNNFIFKETLCGVEIIKDNSYLKKLKLYKTPSINEEKVKLVTKGAYADVYHVQDPDTRNKQGIFYIKTIEDSYHMNKLFEDTTELLLKARYNNILKKWYPVF